MPGPVRGEGRPILVRVGEVVGIQRCVAVIAQGGHDPELVVLHLTVGELAHDIQVALAGKAEAAEGDRLDADHRHDEVETVLARAKRDRVGAGVMVPAGAAGNGIGVVLGVDLDLLAVGEGIEAEVGVFPGAVGVVVDPGVQEAGAGSGHGEAGVADAAGLGQQAGGIEDDPVVHRIGRRGSVLPGVDLGGQTGSEIVVGDDHVAGAVACGQRGIAEIFRRVAVVEPGEPNLEVAVPVDQVGNRPVGLQCVVRQIANRVAIVEHGIHVLGVAIVLVVQGNRVVVAGDPDARGGQQPNHVVDRIVCSEVILVLLEQLSATPDLQNAAVDLRVAVAVDALVVDPHAAVGKLDSELGHRLPHQPNVVATGIEIVSAVVQGHDQRRGGAGEVHPIDRTAVREHVASQTRWRGHAWIVLTQLPVKIVLRRQNRRHGNPNGFQYRVEVALALFQRVDRTVDDRGELPRIEVFVVGVHEQRRRGRRHGFEIAGRGPRQVLIIVLVDGKADNRVGFAAGIDADAHVEVGRHVVQERGAGIVDHLNAYARRSRALGAVDRVIHNPTEGNRTHGVAGRVGIAAEQNAARAAVGDHVVLDHDAGHQIVLCGHGAARRRVRPLVIGVACVRLDSNPVFLRIEDTVAVDDDLAFFPAKVAIADQRIAGRVGKEVAYARRRGGDVEGGEVDPVDGGGVQQLHGAREPRRGGGYVQHAVGIRLVDGRRHPTGDRLRGHGEGEVDGVHTRRGHFPTVGREENEVDGVCSVLNPEGVAVGDTGA